MKYILLIATAIFMAGCGPQVQKNPADSIRQHAAIAIEHNRTAENEIDAAVVWFDGIEGVPTTQPLGHLANAKVSIGKSTDQIVGVKNDAIKVDKLVVAKAKADAKIEKAKDDWLGPRGKLAVTVSSIVLFIAGLVWLWFSGPTRGFGNVIKTFGRGFKGFIGLFKFKRSS